MSVIFKDDSIEFSHSVTPDPEVKKFDLHVHDPYEIFCFVSGQASYLVEGRKYTLSPGTLMLMRSTEAHTLVRPQGVYERYVIHFHADAADIPSVLLAPFDAREIGERNRYRPSEFSGLDTIDFFRRMERSCTEYPHHSVVLSGLISLLCAIGEAFPQKESRGTAADDAVGREMLRFVNANLTEDISLCDVASVVHLSNTQVNRVFKRLTGTTVYDYVLSKRLTMAEGLIEGGEGAMEASRRCGFKDYSSFYRLYKKRKGEIGGHRS
jgi:AraC-like DNA-binding protein